MRTHLVIPDVQVKPNRDYSWLTDVGQFIAEVRPDVIVCIGDFADMPSLSSYDVGMKSFEGRKYMDDIVATREAMDYLIKPIVEKRLKLIEGKRARWNPRMIMTLGNHEERILRAVEKDRKLEDLVSLDDLGYEEAGWEVYDFLEVVEVDQVCYSHYFTSGNMGRPVSSARALILKHHQSCVMGHVQTVDINLGQSRANGQQLVGLFAGTCSPYPEDYLNPQTNNFTAQLWVNDVEDGFFIPLAVQLKDIIDYESYDL